MLKVERILKMFFLKFSNAIILFSNKTLLWRSYITNKILPIIKQEWIIDKLNIFEYCNSGVKYK